MIIKSPFKQNVKIYPYMTNPHAIEQTKSKIKALETAETGTVVINKIGDSITRGWNAGGNNVGSDLLSYVGLEKAAFNRIFGDRGFGYIHNLDYLNEYPNWAFGTGATSGSGAIPYVACSSISTYTRFTFQGTGVDWVYQKGPNCGVMELHIDSETPIEIDCHASTVSVETIPFDDLIEGTHTLYVKAVSGEYRFYGATAKRGTRGVRINTLAHGGKKVSDFQNSDTLELISSALNPDLCVINLIANDYSGQTSLATYESDLQNMITACKNNGADVLITSGGYYNSSFAIPLSSFNDVQKDLAVLNGVAHLDVYQWMIDNNYATQFLTDSVVHLNPLGHSRHANLLMTTITEKYGV